MGKIKTIISWLLFGAVFYAILFGTFWAVEVLDKLIRPYYGVLATILMLGAPILITVIILATLNKGK